MAGTATIAYTIKCELLKSLIEKIQCQKCKSVPGLVEDQKNCYVCKKGHSLCENCKDEICPSPCGSTGSSPNHAIQHLLKDLPAYCPNFKNGCRQISSDSENHEDHMIGCVHREVNCPSFFCHRQKFLFKDLSDHVTFFHTKEHLDDFLKSTENKFDITYGHFFDSDDNKSLSKLDVSNPWIPKQLMTTDGSVFYTVARIVNHSVYRWIYFLGSPQEVIVFTIFHNTA